MSDSYSVNLGADDDDFKAAMESSASSAEDSAAQVAAAWDAASSDVDAAAGAMKASLDSVGETRVEPSIHLDDDQAKAEADELKATLDELGDKSPTVDVNVRGADEAVADLAAIKAGEDAVNDTHVDVDTSSSAQGLEGVDSAGKDAALTLDNVRQRAIDAGAAFEDSSGRLHDASGQFTSASTLLEKLTRDGDDAATALDKAGSSGGNSGNGIKKAGDAADNADHSLSALWTAVIALGPAAVTASAVAASSFAALPAIFAGLATGAGTVFLAFSQIKTVLSDASAAQAQAAQTAQANTAAQNQQAQAAIQVAESAMQEASAQTQAAQQVQSATQSLADTQTSAANSVHSAQEQMQQSEQALTQSEYTETQAQLALTQARQAAANQLINLNDQVKDGALAVEQAQLSISQAKQQLDADLANPAVSALQRQQDQLTYDQAVQHLQDLQDQQTQLQQQQATAQQQGVDGAPAVVQAQNSVQQATQGVANAQQAQSDATAAYAQAQATASEQIANAVQSLANAEAAQTQQAAEYALQQQQQALQTQAAAAATNSASSATAVYEQALAKLSPAGQQFVQFFESQLRPIYTELQSDAETALLPGLQTGIEDLLPLVSTFGGDISVAASGIDWFISSLAKILTSSQGLQQVNAIVKEGDGFMHDLGQAGLDVIQAFLNIGAQAGPIVSTLGGGIEHISKEFENWSSDGGFQHFLDYVEQHGPEVRNLFHELVTTLGHLLTAAAADGPAVLELSTGFLGLVNALLKIPDVGPALVALAGIVAVGSKLSILSNAQSAIGGISRGIKDFQGSGGAIHAVAVALGLIGPAGDVAAEGEGAAAAGAAATDTALLPLIATIGLIVGAVAILAFGAYELVTHWSTVEHALVGVWDDIEHGAEAVFGAILDFFKKWGLDLLLVFAPMIGIPILLATHWTQVETDAKHIWGDILSFFKEIPKELLSIFEEITPEGELLKHWNTVETDAKRVFGDVIKFFDGVPKEILEAFGKPETMLLDVGKNIIEGLLHGLEDGEKLVVNGVKKVGSDIVGAFKSVLSIFSPSQVFYGLAKDGIMAAIPPGLEDGTPAAVSAMQKAAGQLATVPLKLGTPDLSALAAAGGSSIPLAQQVALQAQLNLSGGTTPPTPGAPGSPAQPPAPGTTGGVNLRDVNIYAQTNATAPNIARELSDVLKAPPV